MRISILLAIVLACAPVVHAQSKVQFDKNGIAQLNGKPFFPIGLWVYDASPAVLKDMQSKHFNTVIGNGFKPGDIDAIYKHGMMSVPFATDEFLPAMNHPGLLAWYVTDEPEGAGAKSPEQIKQLHDELKIKDPNHPAGLCHFLFDAIAKYKDGCDFTMSDVYPVTANRDVPLKNVGIHIGEIKRIHGENWPTWAYIQVFGGPDTEGGKWAQPEPEEVRCMTFIALTQRATGILYFSYWAKASKTWASLEKLNTDLQSLAPYLTCDAEEIPVKADNAQIWARARKFEKGWLIFAVNTERTAVEASISIDGLKSTQLLMPFDNNRKVKPVAGVIKQKFAPCEVKVYGIGKPPATTRPSR
jgi:hypothetical protein